MIKTYLIAFCAFFASNLMLAQEDDSITVIDAAHFNKAISSTTVQLIDVRTEIEFVQGALPNAINIDYLSPDDFEREFAKLNKDESVYIYCKSGNRSGRAAIELKQMGFKRIYDLEGGFMNWPYTVVPVKPNSN